jgi:hypothetical protein
MKKLAALITSLSALAIPVVVELTEASQHVRLVAGGRFP